MSKKESEQQKDVNKGFGIEQGGGRKWDENYWYLRN